MVYLRNIYFNFNIVIKNFDLYLKAMLYPGSDLNSALLSVLGDLAYWYYKCFIFRIF
jgi:hypothetical protein